VLVGEAPGREEELCRKPFVGPAGRNLGALLAEIGWSRDGVFLTNLVKYRPIDAAGSNRSPAAAEGRYALSFLLEELAILEPSLVLCLGLTAARILLEDKGLKMAQANGSLFSMHGYRITVTFHPSPFNYHVPSKRAALVEAFHRLRHLSV
jgi:DNA polymerase